MRAFPWIVDDHAFSTFILYMGLVTDSKNNLLYSHISRWFLKGNCLLAFDQTYTYSQVTAA